MTMTSNTSDTVAEPGLVTIGTRGSALALWQADHVADALRTAFPGLVIRREIIVTTGDRLSKQGQGAAPGSGGKAVWVQEIEEALLEKRVDLAVHSLKDVPASVPDGLSLVAFPRRADPRDAFVSRTGQTLEDLPQGARIGTASLRRASQLRALRPDLRIEAFRGNVDTRLSKLQAGVVDATLLACAGLDRLKRADAITERLSPTQLLPAIGQGALALQARTDDDRVVGLCAALNDAATEACVRAERALQLALGGNCRTPVGGLATLIEPDTPGDDHSAIVLDGLVADPSGTRVLRERARGPRAEPESLGRSLATQLLEAGAKEILQSLA